MYGHFGLSLLTSIIYPSGQSQAGALESETVDTIYILTVNYFMCGIKILFSNGHGVNYLNK